MSEVMEQGVLRMPPELWTGDPLDVMQRHAHYVAAADELERLRADLAAAHERIQQLSRQKEQWISDWSDACNEEQRALNLAGLAEAECRKMRSERDAALADLAAARALLREARNIIGGAVQSPPLVMDIVCRIDAALAEERKKE